MTEQEAFLVLNAVPGINNACIHRLVEQAGSAQAILTLREKDLRREGWLTPRAVDQFLKFPQDEFLQNECRLLEQHGVVVLTYRDDDYPRQLKEIPDAPVVLYVKGTVLSGDQAGIAIVGSRRASVYGRATAQRFAAGLAELGIAVISGLAQGIDTAAHRGCLRVGGRTVAVQGCGLSQTYPSENQGLAREILKNGAVISEFPMLAPPLAFHFPRRNRIISGLALGVVVVEASGRSGALITSRFALEQGREVFAVPGPVDHPNTRGTNRLIQQGAKLVSSIEDILEELDLPLRVLLSGSEMDPSNDRPARLSDLERRLLGLIGRDPVGVDDLARGAQCPVAKIQNVLLHLELKHLIKQLPGKNYIQGGKDESRR